MDTAAYRESIVRAVHISLRNGSISQCAHHNEFPNDRNVRRFCVYLGLRERRILRREPHLCAVARKWLRSREKRKKLAEARAAYDAATAKWEALQIYE